MMRRGATRSKSKGAREARRSRSLDPAEPCGEGGLMARCAAMDAEAAARVWSVDGLVPVAEASVGRKAGKGRPPRKLLHKVLAPGAPFQADNAADAVSAAEVAGGVDEEDKRAADVEPAAVAEADDTSPKEGGLRLSKEYVNCILDLKPLFVLDPDEELARMTKHPELYSQEFIDESIDIFRDLAEATERTFARFGKLQAWMRSELEEKGYVEVDDDYIAKRVVACHIADVERGIATEEWVKAFDCMKIEEN